MIGNRKKLLIAAKNERAKELLETLQVNDIVEGDVKSVTSFGAFIDLGGVDGLLHISEMSWGRVDTPKSLFSVGDHVRVYIKNIEDGKIALSCKFPDQNPVRKRRILMISVMPDIGDKIGSPPKGMVNRTFHTGK